MNSAFCYERHLCLERVVSVVCIDTKHSRSTFLGEPMPEPLPEPCPRQGVDRESRVDLWTSESLCRLIFCCVANRLTTPPPGMCSDSTEPKAARVV